jgi:hypothetical protein
MANGHAGPERQTAAEAGRAGRLLSALAVLIFTVGPLWIGLALLRGRPDEGQLPVPRRLTDAPAVSGPLGITDGPRLVRGPEGRWSVYWRTAEPADSFVTYGRSDPAEHVAVKDGVPLMEHLFELPDDSFIPLGRLQVASVGEGGGAATAEIGPGGGGRWSAFRPCNLMAGPLPGLGEGAAAWCDYDADGRVDVATCRADREGCVLEVWAWPADGTAAAPAPQQVSLPGRWRWLRWADVTADGPPDLLVAADRLHLVASTGPPDWRFSPAGTYAQVSRPPDGAEEAAVADVATVADADGDGLPDILRLTGSGELSALHGIAGGGLGDPALLWAPPEGRGTPGRLLAAADFTGDGRTDACVQVGGLLLLAGAEGRWEAAEGAFPPRVPAPGAGAWAARADWDGDGDLDLYVGAKGAAPAALLRNDGVGRFEDVTQTAGELAGLGEPVRCGAWADLDANGRPDLVLGPAGGGVRLFLNAGDGRFMDAAGLVDLPLPTGQPAAWLAALDLTGDGAPDLVIGYEGRPAVALENRWQARPERAYLVVRPEGRRGVAGSVVTLRTPTDGRVVASAVCPPCPVCPAACCFGVRYLPEAEVEVVFSDGVARSLPWRRQAAAGQAFIVTHEAVRP